jgi:DMSO/TMAO reductase YedYZ molybdopterin-dependent catalytic subunit
MSDINAEHSGPSARGRRVFLQGAAALPLAYAAQTGPAHGQPSRAPVAGGQPFPGVIVRQYEPENLEFPLATLDSFLIPNNRLFVRSHFALPNIDVKTWRLRVEGAVERPLELSYEDVLKMEARTAPVLLECAGNCRIFLVPKASGLLWELGAVGTAEWTGVPLGAILDRAGVRGGAVEVILEGADAGEVREPPTAYQSPGRIAYARSLPLAKARQDVLLAHRMNGAELPAAHGFPLRAVVPGWYGMASIKWLSKIIVTDRPFQGYYQTLEYAYFERRHGLPTLTPITELQVKALIARPALNEIVPMNQNYRIHGAAWSGASEVARVEVSTDGGKTWALARLLDRAVANAWRLWEYTWQTPARAGRHVLKARATDKQGRTQPERHDPDRRNSMINFTLPIKVEVR